MTIHRLGIIGDVHAEDRHLEQALTFLERLELDALICTGDIADGRGSVARCVELLQSYQVQTVRGNHDRWVLQDKARHVPDAHLASELEESVLAYLAALPLQIELATSAGPLLLCHGIGANDLQKVWPGTERMPAERSATLDDIILKGDVAWVINGHMHYRTLIQFQALTLINAGTLKNRHHPGFSVADFDAMTLTGYEFGEAGPAQVKALPLRCGSRETFSNTQAFIGDWQPVTLYA